ncbi:hypothetical protein SBFV3_gp33 [Sulfolobales Beppu filamentous virus 3]|uniref:Uncharacterized protein n=1 Tax=Sulfolobales Beppu filamentous virus 3 TaxID=2493124 RepID=A0A3Q8Q774_9VIRU|nr:hypothetical protein HOU83_gp33 [Sulfolobales Beppu filamentous virus 3]AZI75868.1 hypothetical protein SBFV3_gp33 [Sulfolobales Beppu filamentous virus 3]
MSTPNPEVIKKVLLHSVKGYDIGKDGKIIAKVSVLLLLTNMGNDGWITFTKIVQTDNSVILYADADVKKANIVDESMAKYTESVSIKITMKKEFIEDILKTLGNLVVDVKPDGNDILIYINTGVSPQLPSGDQW